MLVDSLIPRLHRNSRNRALKERQEIIELLERRFKSPREDEQ